MTAPEERRVAGPVFVAGKGDRPPCVVEMDALVYETGATRYQMVLTEMVGNGASRRSPEYKHPHFASTDWCRVVGHWIPNWVYEEAVR